MLLYLPALISSMGIAAIIISSILLIHLLFQLVFFLGFLKIRNNPISESHSSQGLPVSVVIAARNEIQLLPILLDRLSQQNYSSFEVIVVNDRSTDGTDEFLKVSKKSYPFLRAIRVDHLPEHVDGKKYALTLGIRAAKYDCVVLTDADCLPASESWLKSIVGEFSNSGSSEMSGSANTDIVIGFSPYHKKKGLLNLIIRFETFFNGIQYLPLAALGVPYMGVGRNLSYRKDLFLKSKGFNGFLSVTGGDDDLFVNKNAKSTNTRVILNPQAVVLSEPNSTWGNYLKQKTRHLHVGKKYKLKHKLLLGLYGFSHLFSWFGLGYALFMDIQPVIMASIFILGYIFFIANFKSLVKRSGSKYPFAAICGVDIVYQFLYIFMGIRAVLTREVEWTT